MILDLIAASSILKRSTTVAMFHPELWSGGEHGPGQVDLTHAKNMLEETLVEIDCGVQ